MSGISKVAPAWFRGTEFLSLDMRIVNFTVNIDTDLCTQRSYKSLDIPLINYLALCVYICVKSDSDYISRNVIP